MKQTPTADQPEVGVNSAVIRFSMIPAFAQKSFIILFSVKMIEIIACAESVCFSVKAGVFGIVIVTVSNFGNPVIDHHI